MLRCAGLLLCLILPEHALLQQFAGNLQSEDPPLRQGDPGRVISFCQWHLTGNNIDP